MAPRRPGEETIKPGLVFLALAIVGTGVMVEIVDGQRLGDAALGTVLGLVTGLVFLGIIALLGRHFAPVRIFNAAAALSLVGLFTSFAGLFGAFISFVAFIKALDYLGFSLFMSLLIAMLLNVVLFVLLLGSFS